ncbi:MAG: hypothetical protein KDN05_18675, partial [Verrucomicrobiae bacterium]|nr:hypothetical protein [Verrucomicrobiae bacterium]
MLRENLAGFPDGSRISTHWPWFAIVRGTAAQPIPTAVVRSLVLLAVLCAVSRSHAVVIGSDGMDYP